ncbi:MAG: NAD(P)H-hydrate dehydratase [Planctomycetota bacterium]|nr:NAD(P)H-hydrate dehydratase [Planctomycetota bacterium]
MSEAEQVNTVAGPKAPPAFPANAHKGMVGKVLCLAGSPEMPGAAQLTLRAAQRGGAGLVALAIFQTEMVDRITPTVPEAVFLDVSRTRDLYAGRLPREIGEYRCDARVAGPGLNSSGRTRELVRRLVEDDYKGPLILDADALNVLASVPELLTMSQSKVVLTPHPGEGERLLDRPVPEDREGRIEFAMELALRSGSLCVLKGNGTVVTDGNVVHVNGTGGPALSTAGTGDVLAGLLGAYAAWSERLGSEDFSLFDAAVSAVHVHGLAGDLAAADLGERAVIASDLIGYLGQAQLQLARSSGEAG